MNPLSGDTNWEVTQLQKKEKEIIVHSSSPSFAYYLFTIITTTFYGSRNMQLVQWFVAMPGRGGVRRLRQVGSTCQ